ncbi:MAG: TatD DNase family protein [Actinomycetota bacterium]
MWTDSHCHDVRDEILVEARAVGVGRFVTVGTDAASSRQCVDAAHRHDDVWAVVGVHPHDAKDALSRSDGRSGSGLDAIVELLDERRVVAIGECGLDYHYDHSPRDVQRVVFAAQVAIANERAIPLVIHTREAWDDTFEVLRTEGVPARTVFHCFTGGAGEARRALDLGCVLSFSGIITFPSAEDLRDAARLCPLDRLLVETDSPYLAPIPHRGKQNRSAWVPDVGAGVARAKGVDVLEVEAATSTTADQVFSLT